MRSEAVFNDIVNRISDALKGAERSILVVTENFKHPVYIKTLLAKAKAGCSICLISGKATTKKQRADFDRLIKLGGQYYAHTFEEDDFRHKGFCLIDDTILITGHYDWKAGELSYDANVIFTYEDDPLVKLIHSNSKELLKTSAKAKVLHEVEAIEESKGAQLSIWNDPAVEGLQLEKKLLEHQLQAYELEKIELDKLLHEFEHRHSMELGDLIIEILHWRKEQHRNDPEKYSEAEADEEAYRKQVAAELKKNLFEISDGDKLELKKTFRKATHLCHPDKVSEAFRDIAMQIFIKLKEAYDANDLKTVAGILEDLKKRQFIQTEAQELSKSVALIEAKKYLEEQITVKLKAIFAIQHSETYQLVTGIEDWDVYFKQTKELLKEELALLKGEG